LNVTLAPDARDGAFAWNRGSTRTEPVKYSAGPFREGCEPLRVILIFCESSLEAAGAALDWYLGASPSKKSVARLKEKVGTLLVPGNMGAWPEVRVRLNSLLRGWSQYFGYGTRMPA
jgi:hypothetical protein